MSILWLLMLLQVFLFASANFYSRNEIILSLSRQSSTNKNDPSEILKHHATTSLARSQRGGINVKLPLYPRGYGGYSVNLSFGTPPQDLTFTVDTGSSLTWFPCEFQKYKYNCTNCHSPGVAHIPTFLTRKSSSSKIVPCQSTQCGWLFPGLHCKKTNKICGYIYGYVIGNTTGLLLNETLTFGRSSVVVDNFTVGCSVASAYWPGGGIVGFGRDPESLPAQMGVTSFSHCLVSHDSDDNTSAASDFVLTTTRRSKSGAAKLKYTPFLTNPRDLSDYYYVELQSISVGPVDVKVTGEYVVPNATTGYGGTVVDSGTTFTVMKKPLLELVLKEFQRQVSNKYKRDKRVENRTGLELCYKVPPAVGKNKTTKLPQLTFIFKAGAQMVLPLSNYFSYADKRRSVLCMTIMSLGDEIYPGPAITLGNYQQQDFYIKYDLENKQLGFRQQKC